jgi:hypothetical protein
MAGPSISIGLVDPGAASRPVDITQIPVYVGIAASGDLTRVKRFSSPARIREEYTLGHLVDVGETHIGVGNREAYLLRVDPSTAGEANGADIGGALLEDVTGTPTQFLAVTIEFMNATGAIAVSAGTLTVRYSLDAWGLDDVNPTWSPVTTLPATGLLSLEGTGLVAEFVTTATPVADASVSFTTTPGEFDASDVQAAAAIARLPNAPQYTFLVLTGETATATQANTNAVALGGELLTAFNAARFTAGMMGAGLEEDTDVIDAFAASFVDPPFVSVGYGAFYLNSPTNAVGRAFVMLRQHEVAAMHVALNMISTDPGRTASGPIKRVIAIDYDAAIEGDALHDARIAVGRSWSSSEGYFIQRQRLLSKSTSNFTSWQDAAIMLVALAAAHRVAFQMVLELFRSTELNTLDPREAADIKGAVDAELGAVLLTPTNAKGTQGHVSATAATVSLTEELPAIIITIRIRRHGYAEDLQFSLQYANIV